MKQPRIGILGGTFDPIHEGHLRAAEEMRDMLSLERVLLVPSATPPHKVGTAGAPLASAQQRLEWTRKAVASRPGLEADDLELRRDGPSYTVDTVREIARRSGEPPVFIIGDDAFALFSTWRAPEQLLALCHFAVMTRPPGVAGSLHDWLPASAREHVEIYDEGRSARHREAGTWIRIVTIDALAISSSEVRARLRVGRSVRYLIPEEVRSEVESSGVYAGPSAAEAGAHS
jgi:nicotinate-nucleotide adenylyltransferase